MARSTKKPPAPAHSASKDAQAGRADTEDAQHERRLEYVQPDASGKSRLREDPRMLTEREETPEERMQRIERYVARTNKNFPKTLAALGRR